MQQTANGRLLIVGAGVMGAAMAMPAADRGMAVDLIGTPLDGAIIAAVAAGLPHPQLKVVLPVASARMSSDLIPTPAADPDVILLGVSSAGIEWAIEALALHLNRPTPILMITKGLRAKGDKLQVLPQVLADGLQDKLGIRVPVVGIAGPCIAGELAARRQTGVLYTSDDPALSHRLAKMLATPYYQPRVTGDLVGVEACAALKNFFAIAVGSAAGQLERYGPAANGAQLHNPAAVLFAQALAEMAEIVAHMGGSAETVLGLAGAGDLYVTCQAGRNSRLGRQLGLGRTFGEAMAGAMKGETVEGAELGQALAPTLRALMTAGRLDAARMPVTCALLESLVDGRPFNVPWDKLQGPSL